MCEACEENVRLIQTFHRAFSLNTYFWLKHFDKVPRCMRGLQLYLVSGAAIASALVGGVFYAFSSFVMAALQRLEPKHGMTAMQAINITAVQPGLMVPFFGTTLAHIVVAITAISNWENSVSAWLLVGSLSFVAGTFALTAVYHVPRNNALAGTAIDDPNAPHVWHRYLVDWTRGNHLRAAASMVAATALTIAIVNR